MLPLDSSRLPNTVTNSIFSPDYVGVALGIGSGVDVGRQRTNRAYVQYLCLKKAVKVRLRRFSRKLLVRVIMF
ncbi:MAG: hypothetical protein DSM106950_10385 [Stigonema ocellatum SAG 48.90 = DSM 106950]|nr:hypothetical protein [Stigonema ocellatum SAG 48.90 = DSM 106950]